MRRTLVDSGVAYRMQRNDVLCTGASSRTAPMLTTGAVPVPSESSFSSAVYFPERLDQWRELDDGEPLAQLHSMFSGESMEAENKASDSKASKMTSTTSGPSDGSDDDSNEIYNDNDNDDNKAIGIYDFLVEYHNEETRHWQKAPAAVLTQDNRA